MVLYECVFIDWLIDCWLLWLLQLQVLVESPVNGFYTGRVDFNNHSDCKIALRLCDDPRDVCFVMTLET